MDIEVVKLMCAHQVIRSFIRGLGRLSSSLKVTNIQWKGHGLIFEKNGLILTLAILATIRTFHSVHIPLKLLEVVLLWFRKHFIFWYPRRLCWWIWFVLLVWKCTFHLIVHFLSYARKFSLLPQNWVEWFRIQS